MGIRTVKLVSQFKPVCAELSDITDSPIIHGDIK